MSIHYPITESNPRGLPHEKQAQLHRSSAKYRWFRSGWGGGKTSWGAIDTAIYAAQYPGSLIFIGRMNDKALKKSTWRTFYEEALPDDIRSKSVLRKTDKVLILPNTTEVHFDHLENPWRFGSVPYDRFWIDECCEPGAEDAIAWLMRAIRGRGAHKSVGPKQGIFTGTPRGKGPLYKLFYEQFKDDPNFFVVEATMEDNPYLDPQHIEEMRKMLSANPTLYRRNFLGEFAEFEGQQFPTFDETIHVDYKSLPVAPEGWIIYRGIDPAIRTTAALWAAQDPDNNGDVFIFREYTGEGKTVAENAAEILRQSSDCGVDRDVIDRKASEQRNVETGTPMIRLWEEAGIYPEVNPDRTTNPSVVRLNQLFSPYDKDNPTIRIHCDCVELINQLNSALWETRMSYSRGKEVRRAGFFHHLDCLQYIVQILDLPFEPKEKIKLPTIHDLCLAQAMRHVKRELQWGTLHVRRTWL